MEPPLQVAVSSVVVVWALSIAITAGQVPSATENRTRANWRATLTPDGVPDLQGVWVNRTATPLERRDVHKGRAVITDAEVAQLRDRAARLFANPQSDAPVGDALYDAVLANVKIFRHPGSTQLAEHDPSIHEREFDNRTSLIVDPPDGRVPPLTPEGRAREAAEQARNVGVPYRPDADPATAAAQIEKVLSGREGPRGPADLSNSLRCITWGLPRVGASAFFTSHYQVVQSRDHVVILQEVNHESRVIPLARRPPLPPAIRQVNGESRGRWDGRTLVVETSNFSSRSYFRGATDNLHLLERFTRVSEDTLEYQVTITDPTTWVRPWTVMVPLKRSEERLYEFACHEGNYDTIRGILSAGASR
jgi:hypothetical protein